MSVDRPETDLVPHEEAEPSAPPPSSADEQLDALRSLLLRSDRAHLRRLQKEVSAAQLTPEGLADAIDRTVRSNPQKLVDVISPIMGPAIRQSIRHTIQAMFQSVNQVVEQSLSWKGVQWRFESWRTGIPFAQVVLMRTLVYRVEEVYLIHRKNGLLLAHVADPTLGHVEAGVISSMLTAIEDFVRDSFRPGQKAVMDTVQFQDESRQRSTTCWIECGTKAILAAVIQGNPPQLVRQRMRDALDRIHSEFAVDLDTFQGDNESFAPVTGYLSTTATALPATDAYLEECLVNEFRPVTRKHPATRAMLFGLPIVALLVLCGWLGMLGWRSYRQRLVIERLEPPATVQLTYNAGELTAVGESHHEWIASATEKINRIDFVRDFDTSQLVDLDAHWLAYVAELRARPGVVVTRAERVGDRYYVRGLRDPLATEVDELIKKHNLTTTALDVQWTPFMSLEPGLVVARAAQILSPPASLQWDLKEGILSATGEADQEWIARTRLVAPTIAGIQRVDLSNVKVPADPIESLLHELGQKPGIVITDIEQREDGTVGVKGMRDELAVDPTAWIREAGIDPVGIAFFWKPFVSTDEPIVYERAIKQLNSPDTVAMQLHAGRLVVSGRASRTWIDRLQAYATSAAGISGIDTSELIEIESFELVPVVDRCEQVVILFESGQATLGDAERAKLSEVAADIKQIVELAKTLQKEPRIDLSGYVSTEEVPARERVALSESRAKVVWSTLVELGIPGNIFVTRGGATQFATSDEGARLDPVQHRRVQMQVRMGSWDR